MNIFIFLFFVHTGPSFQWKVLCCIRKLAMRWFRLR